MATNNPPLAIMQNLVNLIEGIESQIKSRNQITALILIYTAIDSSAWLVYGDRKGSVRSKFVQYANRYLLPNSQLNCNGEELYGARCGILHSLSAESELSKKARIKRIYYAWGNQNSQPLTNAIATLGQNESAIAVKIEDLFSAWKESVLALFEEAENDDSLRATIYSKNKHLFTNLSPTVIEDFLRHHSD